MYFKKTLIISAVNFFEGGPLSVLNDCLSYLNKSKLVDKYKIVALVHKKSLFINSNLNNIEFIEFPKSRQSYFYRLYYEYFYFKKLAIKLKPSFWLSLHDISPNLGSIPQAVYCHNPSLFNSLNLSDLFIQPQQFFFSLFYKYLYSINIHKNKKVIVQQMWIGKEFKKIFSLNDDKILIAPPKVPKVIIKNDFSIEQNPIISDGVIFFYPTFPRPFKNVEIICEAVLVLINCGVKNFSVIITLDGTENSYSKKILSKYKHIQNIDFIGLQPRDYIYKLYAKSSCLIFPSKLETWGLPLSEYKHFNKPIIASNLPYAIETIGDYNKACLFNPNDKNELAKYMSDFITGNQMSYQKLKSKIAFDKNTIANTWEELFLVLLN